jgi:hypothetical protein
MELDFAGLLSGWNLLLGVAVLIVTAALKQSFPKFWDTSVGNRLLPWVPLVLGSVGALLGMCDPDVTLWQERLIVGLVTATVAMATFKIGQTTVFAMDVKGQEIKAKKRASSLPPKTDDPPKNEPDGPASTDEDTKP